MIPAGAKEKGMERICEQPDKAQYRVCSGFRQTLRDLLPVNDGSKDGIMRAVMETSEELDEAIEQGLIPRAHEMNKHLQAVLYEGHNHACEHLHLTPDVLHFLYDLNVGEATCTRSFSKSTKLQVSHAFFFFFDFLIFFVILTPEFFFHVGRC